MKNAEAFLVATLVLALLMGATAVPALAAPSEKCPATNGFVRNCMSLDAARALAANDTSWHEAY